MTLGRGEEGRPEKGFFGKKGGRGHTQGGEEGEKKKPQPASHECYWGGIRRIKNRSDFREIVFHIRYVYSFLEQKIIQEIRNKKTMCLSFFRFLGH